MRQALPPPHGAASTSALGPKVVVMMAMERRLGSVVENDELNRKVRHRLAPVHAARPCRPDSSARGLSSHTGCATLAGPCFLAPAAPHR